MRAVLAVLALGCVDLGAIPPPPPDVPLRLDGADPGDGPRRTVDVVMRFMQFSPKEITVAIGTTVRWTNNDSVQHTVTEGEPGAGAHAFDSPLLGPGGTFEWTFSERGDWTYYCRTHPQVMRGNKVHVR